MRFGEEESNLIEGAALSRICSTLLGVASGCPSSNKATTPATYRRQT